MSKFNWEGEVKQYYVYARYRTILDNYEDNIYGNNTLVVVDNYEAFDHNGDKITDLGADFEEMIAQTIEGECLDDIGGVS